MSSDLGAAPGGRREQKKQATRRQIRDAALQLFVTRGYEQTTVEQIARAADVARQTFFNYFPEKSALLDLMVEEAAELLDDAASETLTRPASTTQRLSLLFADSGARMQAAPAFARMLVVHRSGSFEGPWRDRQRILRLTRSLQAILAVGISQGDVRVDLPLRFLAEMAAGLFTAIVLGWSETEDYPLRERLLQTASYVGEAVQPLRASRRARKQRT